VEKNCLGIAKAKKLTPWKFHITPEKKPPQKKRIVFQPSFFRVKLLNFGGCTER